LPQALNSGAIDSVIVWLLCRKKAVLEDSLAANITVRPIADGKLDEWREFHAALMGSRRIEWAQSQRRRGITRQVVSLVQQGGRNLAVMFTEGRDPQAALDVLADSADAFDVWLMERVSALHGEPLSAETTLDTAPRPGPWKGWRK
jgi:hypothetical protein